MAITIRDIANELEVSTATVSRSLRHDKLIHPDTRARVNEVARHMGYKGHVRRARRSDESDAKNTTLGLLVRFNDMSEAQYDSNLMKMMAGIMAITDEHTMHLKVHTLHPQDQRHMDEDDSLVPPMLQDDACKAVIIHGDQDERDMAFLAHRMPVVSMGRIYRNTPIDAAVADNIEGIHGLITHLVELGHRRLVWVGASYNSTFMQARRTGFMQGCLAYDLDVDRHSFLGPEIYDGRDIAAKDTLLKAVEAGTTAFVCGNDSIALTVMWVMEEAGYRVPEDVSVTGFDAWSHPTKTRQPTTVDPCFFEIGKVAARLALQRVSHPVGQPCIVNVCGRIVVGDSTATAKGSSIAAQSDG